MPAPQGPACAVTGVFLFSQGEFLQTRAEALVASRERVVQEKAAPFNRLARHLFVLATTAAPGKEVRVTGIGDKLMHDRRRAWNAGFAPIERVRWASAMWHTLAWAIFGAAYVGAVVFVAVGLRASAGSVLLVLAAGVRLSQYIGATVGELGFLRGFWSYGARRLSWLEDYAASFTAKADLAPPPTLTRGVRFDHVSFAYPGTDRLVLNDVNLTLPAGSVVAIVGENGAGKSTLVKLLAKMYEPTSGRIYVDDVELLGRLRHEYHIDVSVDRFRDKPRMRISIQGYNDLKDVEQLLHALRRLL